MVWVIYIHEQNDKNLRDEIKLKMSMKKAFHIFVFPFPPVKLIWMEFHFSYSSSTKWYLTSKVHERLRGINNSSISSTQIYPMNITQPNKNDIGWSSVTQTN